MFQTRSVKLGVELLFCLYFEAFLVNYGDLSSAMWVSVLCCFSNHVVFMKDKKNHLRFEIISLIICFVVPLLLSAVGFIIELVQGETFYGPAENW